MIGSKGPISGEKTDLTHTVSRRTNDKDKQNNLHLIVGGAVGGFLLILIILMVIMLIQRHRKPQQFEVTRMEDGTSKLFILSCADLEVRQNYRWSVE